MSPPVKKWTKKDIKSLQGAISSWWMGMSLYLRPGVTKADAFAAMPAGERARIAVAHFRSFAALLEERATTGHTSYRVTHEHYESKRGVDGWGDVTEIVERFKRLERETTAAAEVARKLAARVEAEGLPPEVEAFIPA